MIDSVRTRIPLAALVLAPCLALAGCAQDGSSTALGGPKQTYGTFIGGGVGGLIGSQFGHGTGRVFSALGGTAIGALLGNYIGGQLDAADRERAEAAAKRALASHHATSVAWSNPKSGNSGTIAVKPIHYEHRTSKNVVPGHNPAASHAGQPSGDAPLPSGAPAQENDNNQAVLDNPGASNQAGADASKVDRSLGAPQREASSTIACRTAISTVKLKDQQEPQVTESKFCKQPDGTWAPVES